MDTEYSARKGTGPEAIEVDGTRYHKEESEQGHRDRLKDSVLNAIGLPLLRLSTAGSGEKEKIEQAIVSSTFHNSSGNIPAKPQKITVAKKQNA